jgi:hypothetical protein
MSTPGMAERGLSRKARRNTKKSPAVTRPAPSPELESALASLVAAVTQGDDASRELAVSYVLKNCLPRAVALLCERLVRRLGSLPGAKMALVRVGKAAIPVITDELLRPGNRGERVALAEIAAEIGVKLPVRDRGI